MNAMQTASELTLYTVVGVAVIQDLQSMKISNRLIITGLVLSLVFGIFSGRTSQILYILLNIFFPVIVLYILYLTGVLGAGDIKLFSVIGGFTDFHILTRCMLAAFIAGAVISAVRLLHNRSLKRSLMRAFLYMQGLFGGQLCSYREFSDEDNRMHFSVAIWIGLLIAKAGFLSDSFF